MKNIILICISILFSVFKVNGQTLTGTASYYHAKFEGRKTATGEIFSNSKMTCACNRLPLNTKVRVTNLKNGKSVILRVNDRLAANNRRVVDLTYSAAKSLGFINSGLTQVKVEVIGKHQKKNKEDNEESLEAISKEIVTDTLMPILEVKNPPGKEAQK
jgi:rare lipoprotein A